MDPAGRDLDQEQHVHPPHKHRVDGEEVHRQHTLGLGSEELPPVSADRAGVGATPARRRMVHTVLAPILSLYPRRNSSPWMRRYLRSGSRLPAAAPARGARPPRPAGHAGADRSSGAGPGREATPASPAARTSPARPGLAAAAPAQPAPPGPPSRPVAGHLASQHRDLVAQHERLGVLGRRTPRQRRKPPQHLAEQQIAQSKGHAPIIAARWLPRRTRSSAPTTEFLAPTGCWPPSRRPTRTGSSW
jgi:hypothetical protein